MLKGKFLSKFPLEDVLDLVTNSSKNITEYLSQKSIYVDFGNLMFAFLYTIQEKSTIIYIYIYIYLYIYIYI